LNSIFKTTPFAHQLKAYELSKDRESFALLMEQGTGKSKVIIDTAAYLYGKGRIEALFIVAPNGVHINWIRNEIPAHLHDSIPRVAVAWSPNQTKKKQAEIETLYDPAFHGLRVFAMNVEAFTTDKGKKAAKRFLRTFTCLFPLDESSRIKSPTAKRTDVIINFGGMAPYRRIATGTPVTQSPLDVFTQFQFLDPFILEIQQFNAFKAQYAVLLEDGHGLLRHIRERLMRKHNLNPEENEADERRLQKLTPQMVKRDDEGRPMYRNLDKLRALIEPHAFRVRKSECLDLPEKMYQRVYYEMDHDEQFPMYDSLRKDLRLQLASGELSVVTKLTLVTRLHQVLCGYGPNDTGTKYDRPIFAKPLENPRIQALINAIDESIGGVIIWCRFKKGIADIVEALGEVYPDDGIVQYHGGVSRDARVRAVDDFQAGRARFFVGQQQSGGIGLTLTAARTVAYFANDFSLEARLQSEDRAHRIGQRNVVTYYDIEAIDSMDKRIIDVLRGKRDMADFITGDPKCEWL
jgi:SNF2 family DNA or RNA helicase